MSIGLTMKTTKPKPAAKDAGLVTLSIRVDPELKAALERAAVADDRSMASIIQRVLREWLKAKEFLK